MHNLNIMAMHIKPSDGTPANDNLTETKSKEVQYEHYPELIALLKRLEDRHRKEAQPEDVEWRKMLDDMDVRTWRATKEYHEGDKAGFVIEPSYSGEVKALVDEWNKSIEGSNKAAGYKH